MSHNTSRETTDEPTPDDDHGDHAAEEPWWVVVGEMPDGGYGWTVTDAPDADEAEAEGVRQAIGEEGVEPERIARVTGPFPKHPGTEAREDRPRICHACGLKRWCANHPPGPKQTWFEARADLSSAEDFAFQCVSCGTLTRVPRAEVAGEYDA